MPPAPPPQITPPPKRPSPPSPQYLVQLAGARLKLFETLLAPAQPHYTTGQVNSKDALHGKTGADARLLSPDRLRNRKHLDEELSPHDINNTADWTAKLEQGFFQQLDEDEIDDEKVRAFAFSLFAGRAWIGLTVEPAAPNPPAPQQGSGKLAPGGMSPRSDLRIMVDFCVLAAQKQREIYDSAEELIHAAIDLAEKAAAEANR